MNHSQQTLCEAIKKISLQLKPVHQPISFVLMIGKASQGKSAVLRQSQLEEYHLDGDEGSKLYFNKKGIVLELSQYDLQEDESSLKTLFKSLNRSQRLLKISGIVLCIDTKELASTEALEMNDYADSQIDLLVKINKALGYPVDHFFMFSKLDGLAGFSEFYQSEHDSDLAKALGFSINPLQAKHKTIENYNQRFHQLIELLGQQVIQKLHPARSTIKRTLIREFPLQLLSLHKAIQVLIQKTCAKGINLQALYFCSAEQGGRIIDRLNEKIHHEYALTIHTPPSQANNYRAYFIKDAIRAIQIRSARKIVTLPSSHKNKAIIAAGLAGISLLVLGYSHLKTTHLLDETSKELLAYETLLNQSSDRTQALYHLSRAENKLNHASSTLFLMPSLNELKTQLHANAKERLNNEMMPSITAELEAVIGNPSETAAARYKALKIYLMLSQTSYFSEAEVLRWFESHWKAHSKPNINKKLTLLKQMITLPLQRFPVQQQFISDARNYLNALPPGYLYYSLAKESFSPQIHQLNVQGINLASQTVPVYYTKAGFSQVMKDLPDISTQLTNEQWVLSGKTITNLQEILLEAYCYDYGIWWKNFIKRSNPSRFQSYQQGRQIFQAINQNNTLEQLIHLVQAQTSPELQGDYERFNEKIASQFTHLNLINQSSIQTLRQTSQDMEKFLTTLSFVKDGGYTAFSLSKARFNDKYAADPVTSLFLQAERLPAPLGEWAKQMADDSWAMLMSDTRSYINQQWQQHVYLAYKKGLAERYPLKASEKQDIALDDFKQFFAKQGILNQFISQYLKPFIDSSTAQWQPKSLDGYRLPISNDTMNELMRANVISNMFFPQSNELSLDFSLRKINLDPIISQLEFSLGSSQLLDNQENDSFKHFKWPQNDAKLALDSIDGNHYEITEQGPWALFRLLDKLNVMVDEKDSSKMQILLEINANSGRYVMKTKHPLNPFIPGILNGFSLQEKVA